MKYYYNPEIRLLLINQTDAKELLVYGDNARALKVPMIGPRPPYYTNPRYEPHMPVI